VQAGVFEVDLWRFQGGLAEARWCPDDEAVAAALEGALAECRGNLLEGSYSDWVEPIRESLRRQALDALARLSELRAAAGKREAALGAVEQAIGIDPYAEDLYRRGIRLLAQLGQAQAARRLFRQLEGRLAELDAEPEEETLQLLREMGL
jgi:DNA-binding SARP family transcriptional activator